MIIDAFTSDQHYGHKNILKFCEPRGEAFEDIEAHNEALIENYNSVVTDDMTVCHVGDIFFCSTTKAKKIMDRLNGRKILVHGNHDRSHATMVGLGFELVADRLRIPIAGRTALICHYPYKHATYDGHRHDLRYMDRRPEKKDGEVLIHGHIHSDVKVRQTMIHVGVDAWDFKPCLFSDVETLTHKIYND